MSLRTCAYRRAAIRAFALALFALLAVALSPPQARAQTLNPLYSFTGGSDGDYPAAGLIQATDGALYGAAYFGGTHGSGSVFRITTDGTFTTLYSFTGGSDGGYPSASLIQATDGALYGTTVSGGINNVYGVGAGTVFKVTTDGTLTTLYRFTGYPDGDGPIGDLIQAADGALYGTTEHGGDSDTGAIFKITTDGTVTTLYSFTGYNDGAYPQAGLIQAADGALYGATIQDFIYEDDGPYPGTVFKITTDGTFTPLYGFTGGSDGGNPTAGLIQAADGALYGTTLDGGIQGWGTVFKITTDGTFTALYSFTNGPDGGQPYAPLMQAADGALYGAAYYGGTHGWGAIFKITTGGTLTTLYSFTNGSDGAFPKGGLMQAADGALYGTTSDFDAGAAGDGTVFQLVLPPSIVTPSAGANGTISPSTPQTVTYDHAVTFTAAPATGYMVSEWRVDGANVQAGGTSYKLTNVTANHTINVTFALATFPISPTAGSGGSISPNTVQSVSQYGTVAFTATPAAGKQVSLWNVDNVAAQTGGNSFTLSNVTAKHTVSVSFKNATYTLTPSAGADGTISPNAVQTVGQGGAVTFTATPSAHYMVSEWQVDGANVQAGGTSYRLSNVTANHTVNVTFALATFPVTPAAASGGTISPNTVQNVSYGGSVTFTATPNAGKQVALWSVDNTAIQVGGTSYTLPDVLAKHTVSVSFQNQTYTVTPSAGGNGTISPNSPQTVSVGGAITFTAAASAHYAVSEWQVDGANVQAGGGSYRLTNITANHAVNVTFAPATLPVTPAAGSGGTIGPNAVQNVSYGGSVTFTATPNSGKQVSQWSVDNVAAQTGGNSFTLSSVTAKHAVSVSFTNAIYTITPSAGAGGTISPSTPQTRGYGGAITFTASPSSSGNTVDVWQVDGVTVQTGGQSYRLTNVTANHTVTVTFNSV